MKKIFLTLIALFAALSFVRAVPANPTPFTYTQPDGSIILLQLHGDEYLSWITLVATGETVEKGADGFYRPVPDFNLAARAAEARQRREINYASWSSYEHPFPNNFGDNNILCLLIEFADEDSYFVVENPHEHFYNMLNQEGYNYDGAIGSVRDYYLDNSHNQYRPSFDVFGPVKVSQTKAYCSDVANNRKSVKVYEAIMEAYEKLASQIDIGKYDNDGDGNIDMILCYYPGHNPAEMGDADNVWPHQSTYDFGTLGGKIFNRYFCTSELRNAEGTDAAAIGTTCHEFAHSLGLPDFYDTDYEENGYNVYTTGSYDLMSGGNYNDSGRRPPYLSAVELNMLGWMPAPTDLSESGDYTLDAVQNYCAYTLSTQVAGESYLLEARVKQKWDSALAPGLLVYHIDKSERIVGGGASAAYLWGNTNHINIYGGHPCYYLVLSASELTYLNDYVWPGRDGNNQLSPTDWDGNPIGISLTNIAKTGTGSSFTLTVSAQRRVFGHVTDTDGNSIQGAQVSLTQSTMPFAAPSLPSGSLFTTTDDYGNYAIDLEDGLSSYQILTVQKEGFVSVSLNMSLSQLYTSQNVTLFRQGEGPAGELCKIDPSLNSLYNFHLGSGSSYAAGMMYTAEEIAAQGLAGALLHTVSFAECANQGESIYVVIDFGDERVLCKDVTGQYQYLKWATIDLLDENLVIPAGKDIYIGIGIDNIPEQSGYYPFLAYGVATYNGGACYAVSDFKTSSDWQEVNFGGTQSLHCCIRAKVSMAQETTFASLGVSYITLEAGVPSVVAAAGKSLKSITWYLDGVPEGSTPTAVADLPDGAHTYMARLQYYDGSAERIYYDVEK